MASRKPPPSARGLGWRHRQQVAALKRQHRDGVDKCAWCGEVMWLSQGLAGDHELARTNGGMLATRLLHNACNSARGSGDHDDQAPALTGVPMKRDTTVDLGRRIMSWPI
jgi:hypothetical protein